MRGESVLIVLAILITTACMQEDTGSSASSMGEAVETEVGSSTGEDSAQGSDLETPVLDLSEAAIRETLDEIDDGKHDMQEAQALLPEMFDEQADTPGTRISGGVLTREDAESLQDSLDGVEIKLEMETP